ncbi:MAG: DNA polymerase domain-containing protein [Infirmifilum sp.]|uniref:DNA polymerase domain-containing protein n=1 Tax=Infirmifilum TaxID=2856573 RepID=UPI00235491AF
MKNGFLYDIAVADAEARLWFKSTSGAISVEKHPFQNYFYVDVEAFSGLDVFYSEVEEVKLRLFPRGFKQLVKVSFETQAEYRSAKRLFEQKNVETYASDVPVYHKVLAPHGYVPMTLRGEEYRIEPLPMKTARFSLIKGPAGEYALHFHAGEEFSVRGPLDTVLLELSRAIQKHDPDIVSSNLSYEELRGLAREARRRGIRLGRGEQPLEGRIFIEHSLLERIGLTGLEERSRFTFLPPTHAARVSYGRMIDLRQSYVLLSRGYAVPRRMNLNIPVRTAWEIHLYDKGGLIIRPRPGLYRNVAVLDFESMFPNLIVKRNISYETVNRRGVRRRPRGLLPELIEDALRRRLYYKGVMRSSSGPDTRWADERQSELKMILVSSYGYSGNNYNRLGNPLTFEWINRYSRRVMLEVLGYVERQGFKVIYGDTDSVFLQGDRASAEDYERLALRLSERVGLPMRLDNFYEWLFLFPDRDEKAGVAKRYIGVSNGKINAKGVEAVRSGVPRIVKKAQLRIVERAVRAKPGEELKEVLLRELEAIYEELYSARPEDLVAGSTLRKERYLSRNPVFIAAQQLRSNGYTVAVGDYVEYVWVDALNPNPYLRVQAWKLYDGRGLDMKKYTEILDRALSPILLALGFRPEVMLGHLYPTGNRSLPPPA